MSNYDSKNELDRSRLLEVIKIEIPLLIKPSGSGPFPPPYGSLASYAVVAGSTVTNTGSSVLTGQLALSPGSSVTGFPPGTSGTQHVDDSQAVQAQADNTAAYNDLASRTPFTDLSGQDLGGMTLSPGVYRFSSSAQLTGTLTLNGGGDPSAVFIFQIGSTLTTASSSVVLLSGGAVAGNVYWQVGSSATLGTSTTFKGSIFALASITATTSASVTGGLYAQTGAVTLDTNAVSASGPVENPANESVSNDEPGMLWINTQGVTQISVANGSVDKQIELNTITFASPNDIGGVFNLLLRINEPVVKIVSAQLIERNGPENINLTYPTGSLQGVYPFAPEVLPSNSAFNYPVKGQSMIFNAHTSHDLSSYSYNATLVVRYVVGQS